MNFVFIVAFQFPYGSASSMRARHLYRLLESAGHCVHVISDFDTVSQTSDCSDYSYESVFDCCMTFQKRRCAGTESVSALKRYCAEHSVDCVLMNAKSDRLVSVARFCKQKNIRLMIENCEWYDSSAFKLGKWDFRYHLNQKMIQKGFREADGFISISRLLHVHNKSFGKPSVRIPTILDVENTAYSAATEHEKLMISYTGHPERSKEYLLPMIRLLAEKKDLALQTEFHIYGPSYSDVLRNIGGKEEILKRAGSSVRIHDNIPQDQVDEVLRNTDFLLFLRPDRRSSHAGFPTKLGESFAVGTPVISNDTGDIGLYVKNGINGFLIDLPDESLERTVRKILNMGNREREAMRRAARETAEQNFDYRVYSEAMKRFLESFEKDKKEEQ